MFSFNCDDSPNSRRRRRAKKVEVNCFIRASQYENSRLADSFFMCHPDFLPRCFLLLSFAFLRLFADVVFFFLLQNKMSQFHSLVLSSQYFVFLLVGNCWARLLYKKLTARKETDCFIIYPPLCLLSREC